MSVIFLPMITRNCSHASITESTFKKCYYKRSENKDVLEGYTILYKRYVCNMCGNYREIRSEQTCEERDINLDISREDLFRYKAALKLCDII